jgi:hypothetical protein
MKRKRYIPFNFEEARRNPEMNPHIGAWDYVDKYKNDPDVYISFTEIDKIGINPRSKYNTPVGIYTYPLKELVKLHLNIDPRTLEREKVINKIGDYVPFAGNAKYVNFIKCKDKSHFVNDMYKDYGSNNYDRDIKILDNNYRQIVNTTPNFKKNYSSGDSYIDSVFNVFYNNKIGFKITYIQEGRKKISKGAVSRLGSFDINFREIKTNKVFLIVLEDIIKIENLLTGEVLLSKGEKKEIFDFFIQDAISTSKQNNPIMSIWNITRLLADKLSNNAKQASTKWNLILSKDLGYSGFADKSGKGYIHPSEPMQAVFLNIRAFEVIARIENVPAKKRQNIFSYKVGDKFEDVKSGTIFTITKIGPSPSGNRQYKTSSKHGNFQFSEEEIEYAITEGRWKRVK